MKKVETSTKIFGILYAAVLVIMILVWGLVSVALTINKEEIRFEDYNPDDYFFGPFSIIMYISYLFLAYSLFLKTVIMLIVHIVFLRRLFKENIVKGFMYANIVLLIVSFLSAIQFSISMIISRSFYVYGLLTIPILIFEILFGTLYSCFALNDKKREEKAVEQEMFMHLYKK